MADREKIMKRLTAHYNIVKERAGEESLLGVFLYGSQNYNLDNEESDVDSRAIIIPTLHEVLFDKPISTTIELGNGEQIDVKDIREMIKCFEKQNVTFLEILFTDYFILNKKYIDYWNYSFKRINEAIAKYKPNSCIGAMYHQAMKYFSKNDMYNYIRICHFLEKYSRGYNFKECIYFQDNDYDRNILLNLKMNIEAGFIAPFVLPNPGEENYSHLKILSSYEVEDIMEQGAIDMISINK